MAVRFPKLKTWQWGLLFLGAVAGAVGAFLLLQLISIPEMIREIAALGPVPFFLGLAILPAVGAPATPFYLLAGASFGTKVAVPVVLGGLAVNLALSYVMARWVMRPLIVKIVKRLGYEIPLARHEDRWNLTLLVRITPGPPYPIQNYVLGLAGVPFGVYMVVSMGVASCFAVAFTVFGESLMSGRSGLIFFGVSMLVAAFVAIRLVRGMVQRRAARDAG
ncbi:hypothetical protein ASA1KI_45930 [Opitutales bacterium ASA1]|uniref:TVP38/TMEM64 family protein n=1 Tax=Congregicoccus parvus TaxID=3081749 RepID=UPI002B28F4B8|nr:hypothetical protein ASA1KI_45930 [Opitutales bacterium ASA1]